MTEAGNAFDGMDGRHVGCRHDVYDVPFLVSRHCGFDTRGPVVPE
jgi:hypothetical protein